MEIYSLTLAEKESLQEFKETGGERLKKFVKKLSTLVLSETFLYAWTRLNLLTSAMEMSTQFTTTSKRIFITSLRAVISTPLSTDKAQHYFKALF